MGCGIQHVNKINIQTEIFIPTKKSNDSIETKHSFNRLKLNKISKNNWLKIIDYLQYQELKEVAKTNRLLNYLSKDDKILIKFFKKKMILLILLLHIIQIHLLMIINMFKILLMAL